MGNTTSMTSPFSSQMVPKLHLGNVITRLSVILCEKMGSCAWQGAEGTIVQFELPFEHGCSLTAANCFNEGNTESWKIRYSDQVNHRVRDAGQAFVVAHSWYSINITGRIKKIGCGKNHHCQTH